MKLLNILENTEYTLLQGDLDKDITDIIYDSRKLSKACVFV